MRLGFDLVPELIAGGGIRRYAVELRRRLRGRSDIDLRVLGPSPRRRSAPLHRVTQGLAREGWHYTGGLGRQAWRAGVEVVHCPAFAPARCPVPLVLTVHDVLPMRHPELFPRVMVLQHRLLAHRARRAARVIVTTRLEREEAIELLGLEPERVRVVPLAVADTFRPVPADPSALRQRFGIDRPYVLTVGTLEPRKNLVGALRAMRAAELGSDVALVVVGAQGWKNEAFEREAREVTFPLLRLGPVGDDELVQLYGAARCLLFPSLFEGYGLPPVEAMRCDCPVVSSDRSSLPEVVGDAGLLADPLDPGALGAAVRTLVRDDGQREELRRRGLARVAGLTWDAVAEQTVGVLREAAAEGSA